MSETFQERLGLQLGLAERPYGHSFVHCADDDTLLKEVERLQQIEKYCDCEQCGVTDPRRRLLNELRTRYACVLVSGIPSRDSALLPGEKARLFDEATEWAEADIASRENGQKDD